MPPVKDIAIHIFKAIWSVPFGFFLTVLMIAAWAILSIGKTADEAKKLPTVEERAAIALETAKKNDQRISGLEEKLDEQGRVIEALPSPVTIIRGTNAKPFSDPALRARAERLRREQRQHKANG
jgi:uncharacterized coiled-coil protein SlyX